MKMITLAIQSIAARILSSSLCVAATAAGIALLCAVMLLSNAIETGLTRNAQGIDVVVGAKGSPLQLVLSTVYHADVPTGNIENEDARKWSQNHQVASAIPLALGDNYHGYRIAGTTPAYLDLYHASLAEGAVWAKPFDAVAGAMTGLAVGTQFAGVHGLSADSDDVHNFHLYTITGRLKPTGTVLDRLILTSVESVQELHRHPDAGDPDAAEEAKIANQVTALLIKTRGPMATINLPREINRSSNVLAANPGYEMTRFSETLGFGRSIINVLGCGFIALSALVLLSTLAASLTARRYDLGVLRVLGASPEKLFGTVVAEGVILGAGGALAGIIGGHIIAWAVATSILSLQGLMVPARLLAPGLMDGGLFLLGAGVGLLAALVPAMTAARTDIATLLARGRL